MSADLGRIPATIVTGFLGAGRFFVRAGGVLLCEAEPLQPRKVD